LPRAKNAPDPDEQVIGFGFSSGFLSVTQLNEAVQQETPNGRAMLEILEHAASKEGIDRVIDRILKKQPQA
jgi:hypothetical protein